MTRETKLGLLVGLGFIILFGIVLSEAGSKRRGIVAPTYGPRAPEIRWAGDGKRAVPDAPPAGVQVGAGQGGVESPSNEAKELVPVAPQEPVGVPLVTVAESHLARGGVVVVPPIPEAADMQSAGVRLAAAGETAGEAVTDPVAEADAVAEPVASTGEQAERSVSGKGDMTAGEAAVGPKKPSPGARGPATYVVQRNDSLTKIAQRELGTADREVIEALYKVNQKRLKNKDHLLVGQKLRMPTLAGREEFEAVADFSPAAVHAQQGTAAVAKSGQSGRGGASYRWYEVRRNDTWRVIAARELGQEGRWRELYELNRRAFPEPDRIRVGVRVRLPSDGKGGSEAREASG